MTLQSIFPHSCITVESSSFPYMPPPALLTQTCITQRCLLSARLWLYPRSPSLQPDSASSALPHFRVETLPPTSRFVGQFQAVLDGRWGLSSLQGEGTSQRESTTTILFDLLRELSELLAQLTFSPSPFVSQTRRQTWS